MHRGARAARRRGGGGGGSGPQLSAPKEERPPRRAPATNKPGQRTDGKQLSAAIDLLADAHLGTGPPRRQVGAARAVALALLLPLRALRRALSACAAVLASGQQLLWRPPAPRRLGRLLRVCVCGDLGFGERRRRLNTPCSPAPRARAAHTRAPTPRAVELRAPPDCRTRPQTPQTSSARLGQQADTFAAAGRPRSRAPRRRARRGHGAPAAAARAAAAVRPRGASGRAEIRHRC